ncbi:hypothetical protein BJV74DRAFT_855747 [Russula compacta]|nr:hypothetical protein BJV74DRAFT_855747 [Russula compacta]
MSSQPHCGFMGRGTCQYALWQRVAPAAGSFLIHVNNAHSRTSHLRPISSAFSLEFHPWTLSHLARCHRLFWPCTSGAVVFAPFRLFFFFPLLLWHSAVEHLEHRSIKETFSRNASSGRDRSTGKLRLRFAVRHWKGSRIPSCILSFALQQYCFDSTLATCLPTRQQWPPCLHSTRLTLTSSLQLSAGRFIALVINVFKSAHVSLMETF